MYVFTILGLLVATVCLFIYRTFKKSCQLLKLNGIPYIEPEYIFGNFKDVILHQKTAATCYQELYEKLQPHRFAGVFQMHTPFILIRDPELVKQILVKDFSYFNQHNSEEMDRLERNLFTMKGDEWKNTRTKLISAFSSLKLKTMFPLIKKCGENMVEALQNTTSNPHGIEVKELGSRYATDVIGSYAFGVDAHSLENPKSKFRQMIMRVFSYNWRTVIRGFFPKLPEKLVKLFGLHIFDKEACDYFINIIKNEVERRNKDNLTRGDFLDLLIAMKHDADLMKMNVQNDNNNHIMGHSTIQTSVEMTFETMTAHSFLFFSGSFSTTASAFSFLLFELAQNLEIQNKVRSEILSTLEQNGGDLTYEMLSSMPYFSMVIAESLRKHSPVGFIHRKCSKNYRIPQSDVIIAKGTPLIIPIKALHNDEKYYRKPREFHPEHFSESAKAARPRSTYLAFGEGPRSCIAERFAKIQLMVGIAYILKQFFVELSPETKLPLDFTAAYGSTITQAKGKIWLLCRQL